MRELPTSKLIDDGATCVFVYCRARVETAVEMRRPGPSAGSVMRIKPHEIVGAFDFWGPCPASLMALPLGDAAHAALGEVRRAIDRAAERRKADADRIAQQQSTATREPDRHSLWPRPGDSQYFRSNGGSSPRHNPPYNRPT